MEEFVGFPKIARLSREIIITEKIDGTNAQILIGENGEWLVGSRKQWITPENDNHGFAAWALRHKDELIAGLGVGRHFGEWWGSGIQRGYGLSKGEKRFSLFNTNRWGYFRDKEKYPNDKPDCCYVVPVLYQGLFDTECVKIELNGLERRGSDAAPGFMNPEGIVIYHTAANMMFKKTIKNDEKGKGE
ncbi:MAG: RNA ligase family protein [Candidatus Omnitrophica bacterium]|nr:RNA ligase family protein [Candidatus Omnitrophota bacterium]